MSQPVIDYDPNDGPWEDLDEIDSAFYEDGGDFGGEEDQ